MNVIVILVIVSVSVASIFLGAYFWSVKTGQYDDMESPAVRILLDDGIIHNDSVSKDIDKLNNPSNNKIK